jgi:hypothetical protein
MSTAPRNPDVVGQNRADDGSELIRLCGQGSAGVDIAFMQGIAGEWLTVSLRFRVVEHLPNTTAFSSTPTHTVAGSAVVLTVGDAVRPFRIVVQDGIAYATGPSNSTAPVPLGPVDGLEWHLLNVKTQPATGAFSAAVDGGRAVTVHSVDAPMAAVWLYLGQGYRGGDIAVAAAGAGGKLGLAGGASRGHGGHRGHGGQDELTRGLPDDSPPLCSEIELASIRTDVSQTL